MSVIFKDLHNRISPQDPEGGSSYLDKFFEYHHIDFSVPEKQIILRWKDLAGPDMAEYSKCNGVSNGTLFVVCKNQAQASLVRLNKRELMKNVCAAFPELNINKISVRVE